MKIYENARIRVTLTDEQSARFNDRRDLILSHAMRVLGHRSELSILATETVSDDEARTETMEILTYQYLSEHCRYNLGETLMRMNGGHRMSCGMSADVDAAHAQARNELIENPALIELGRKSLADKLNLDRKYSGRIASSEWQIEIIGDMPKQIGMCRYQEAK